MKLGGQAQPEDEITRGMARASEGPPEGAEPTQTIWWTCLTTPTSETTLCRRRHKRTQCLLFKENNTRFLFNPSFFLHSTATFL